MDKKELTGQATESQIKEWKKSYRDVYAYMTEDTKICYLKPPTRQILEYCRQTANNNVTRFNETMIEQCWLGGDEDIKAVDKYFRGLSNKLGELIEVVEGNLLKL